MRSSSTEIDEIIALLEFVFLDIKPIVSENFLNRRKESKGLLSNQEGFFFDKYF